MYDFKIDTGDRTNFTVNPVELISDRFRKKDDGKKKKFIIILRRHLVRNFIKSEFTREKNKRKRRTVNNRLGDDFSSLGW